MPSSRQPRARPIACWQLSSLVSGRDARTGRCGVNCFALLIRADVMSGPAGGPLMYGGLSPQQRAWPLCTCREPRTPQRSALLSFETPPALGHATMPRRAPLAAPPDSPPTLLVNFKCARVGIRAGTTTTAVFLSHQRPGLSHSFPCDSSSLPSRAFLESAGPAPSTHHPRAGSGGGARDVYVYV